MNSITPTNKTELVQVQDQGSTNPAYVYLAGLNTKGGRRTQEQALHAIAELLGAADAFSFNWAALRYEHCQAIKSKLAEDYSPATANRFLSALRQTLKAAFLLGQMSADDYTKATMIGNVTGQTLPAGRELSPGEMDALAHACANDPSPAGARDNAIVALLYACGLRRAELVGLELADVEYRPDHQDYSLKILGKRNKQRIAYLVNGAARAMGDWLVTRGDDPGALFRAINKGGIIRKGRMTSQAIYNMLAKRAEEAGVKDFSPHDFRRTFVSDLLDAGADIATVAKMAGHASVTTTARYDRRPEAAKQKAAGLLHYPNHRASLQGIGG